MKNILIGVLVGVVLASGVYLLKDNFISEETVPGGDNIFVPEKKTQPMAEKSGEQEPQDDGAAQAVPAGDFLAILKPAQRNGKKLQFTRIGYGDGYDILENIFYDGSYLADIYVGDEYLFSVRGYSISDSYREIDNKLLFSVKKDRDDVQEKSQLFVLDFDKHTLHKAGLPDGLKAGQVLVDQDNFYYIKLEDNGPFKFHKYNYKTDEGGVLVDDLSQVFSSMLPGAIKVAAIKNGAVILVSAYGDVCGFGEEYASVDLSNPKNIHKIGSVKHYAGDSNPDMCPGKEKVTYSNKQEVEELTNWLETQKQGTRSHIIPLPAPSFE